MGLGIPFSTPYYLGTGSSASVTSSVQDVALGGRAYLIDWSADTPLVHTGLPIQRDQADQSLAPGEQSLNRQGLWRRTAETWHMGAGQDNYDREESNRERFRESKGIDIWEEWQLTNLPDVETLDTSANTNLFLVVAGDHLYRTDGNDIIFTTSLTGADTILTGAPVTNPTSITTDGFNVWTAHNTDGVYKTTRGAAATAARVTGTVDLIAYVKGYVMAAAGDTIYDITTEAVNTGAADVLPAAHFTHTNVDWVWTSFAQSATHIYVSGFSGDKSQIYSISIAEDGISLDPPVLALTLPDGEVAQAIYGYLGQFLMIGSNRGWRFALANADGTLTPGALVETPEPVLAFEGQEEFIWFGWSNFDATSTGLGRLSTAFIADPEALVPAYASDLMTTGQGDTLSIATFIDPVLGSRTVYSISGVGFFYTSDDLVTTGFIDSGWIGFGIVENKLGLWIDIDHSGSHDSSIEVQVRTPNTSFASIGTHEGSHDEADDPLALGMLSAPLFEIRIILNSDTVDPMTGQLFNTWTFRVNPEPEPTDLILASILISPEVETLVETTEAMDAYSALDFIALLRQQQTLTTWQEGNRSWSVVLEEYEIRYHRLLHGQEGYRGFNGTALLQMKVIQ